MFDVLLAEAQRTKPEDLISQEELGRRRPLTDEDRALADEYLDTFNQLEAEQGDVSAS